MSCYGLLCFCYYCYEMLCFMLCLLCFCYVPQQLHFLRVMPQGAFVFGVELVRQFHHVAVFDH